MKTYELRCMSFDGEYVTDHKGTLEECQNASTDMGSKWFFYPWHVITTSKGFIKEACGCLYNMSTHEPILGEMFNGRYFKTMQDRFRKVSKDFEDQELDMESFESFVFRYNA